MFKYTVTLSLVLTTMVFSFILKPGTQMKSNETFEISYDIEFNDPFIHPTDSTQNQDQSIKDLLTTSIISDVIANVNPANTNYNLNNTPIYDIGNEVIFPTNCHIEYVVLENPNTIGYCDIPANSDDYNIIEVGLNANLNTPSWDWGG
ncbi:MAG: hypothetical protein KAH33_01540 [Candidatus Delongbacteria bacterium]|nr:hypothetical protein [Candidatus Delongbacteria bacterium]